MKTYLLTGGAGFLGKVIASLICSKNIDQISKIIAYDIKILPKDELLLQNKCQDAGLQFQFIRGDITDLKSLKSAMVGVDVAIHLAAMIDFRGLIDDKVLRRVNVTGTQKVIEACQQSNVQFLVFTSSIEVVCPNEFGDDFILGDESTKYRGKPIGKYGRSKKAAEDLILSANNTKLSNGQTLQTVAIRLAGVYGEDDPIIKPILKNTLKRKVIATFKTKKTTRMYVGNAAWCHLLAAKKMQVDNSVCGKAYFTRDDTPDLPYVDLNILFFGHCGFLNRPTRIPFKFIYIIVWFITFFFQILNWIGINKQPPLTTLTLRIVQCEFTSSDKLFRRQFDYKPLFDWPTSCTKMKTFFTSYVDELENIKKLKKIKKR